MCMSLSLLIAWCTGSSSNTVTIQDFSFSLPTTYQSISPTALDNAQIAHHIIAAWKAINDTLILSESSIPSTIDIKTFTEQTQARLTQNMIWYDQGKISSTSFTCNNTKISAYLHHFVQTDTSDKTKINVYYDQLYFIYNDSIYILSLAQKEEKSIFSDIVDSLACVQKSSK